MIFYVRFPIFLRSYSVAPQVAAQTRVEDVDGGYSLDRLGLRCGYLLRICLLVGWQDHPRDEV